METKKNTIDVEIRSEEVQEILTRVPHWMIRWGNTLFFGVILLLLFISWFIKYPDILNSEGVITTQIPPEREMARSSGKLQAILVKDRTHVNAGQPLAIIENSANYKDVFYLKSILDTIQVRNNSFSFPFDEMPLLFLGDIDSQYALFENSYIQYQLNKQLKPFSNDAEANKYSLSELKLRLQNLITQQEISKTELSFQKKELERNTTLYKNGVISAQDYENSQLKYAQAERSYANFESSISQVKQSIATTKQSSRGTEINRIKEEMTLLKSVIQTYNQLKKAVKDWEYQYVLKSNITGSVSYLNYWNENQTVQQGDMVFIVIPDAGSSYIAKLKTPAANSGKIKVGQEVHVQVENYPDKEFGVLNGIVQKVSIIPDEEGNYIVDVSLPKELVTSYHKNIEFKQEMSCTAEIITDDLRLIERFFHQFKSQISG
ncbi:HlyD family secretion protein [Neptunitalea lumnitzerae]|uniref:Hemolysin n=1 Tax=Neptunitalea lumnitzerae TaxID=2965509 RepID=A0ABQ5MGP9_9FLAO|nr:HlyD family efflux transporter periplasmic adaptor subunit [Neptunitalea sp. Y10]GLB48606.1 hemolysin [Neptunitalea sp. Y10]